MARPGAHRKFYDFTHSPVGTEETDNNKGGQGAGPEELVRYVAENIIGADTVFTSPFGPRRVVYCDYIASGRAVRFLEEYIAEEVLPHYGSTHTTATLTALQTTLFRHEARDIIRNAVRASEYDRVVLVGSGATGALHKLIHAAGLGVRASGVPTTVFVDPHAHHSSLLPWREAGAKVVRIRESRHGGIDRDHLESCLRSHSGQSVRLVGCLAAASNITGTVADDVSLTMLLHRYGALAFWDYATAAPYLTLRMNPVVKGDTAGQAHKDAIFFSTHKFLGGVQTPGVLVAKKGLFASRVPEVCGGGTVFFVSRESHRYLQDVETREEGGTPAIVESVRAGLVLQLKEAITPHYITTRNAQLARRLNQFVKSVPQLEVLGNVEVCDGHDCRSANGDTEYCSGSCEGVGCKSEGRDCGDCRDPKDCGGNCLRLPILSFLVRHPTTQLYLHHNFVCAVLNDVYGIQARGGCACAGPYAQDVMGLNEENAQRYERQLVEDPRLDRSHLRRRQENSDLEVLRPGFVRLNLPYTASDEQIEFILSGVHEVCQEGWKLLPQYILNPETGEWKHHTNTVYRGRLWLQGVSYATGKFSYTSYRKVAGGQDQDAPGYSQCLKEAQEVFSDATKAAQRRVVADDTILFEGEAAALRWFLLPSEARALLASHTTSHHYPKPPFCPVKYPLSNTELNSRPDYEWHATGDNMTLGAGIVSEGAKLVGPGDASTTELKNVVNALSQVSGRTDIRMDSLSMKCYNSNSESIGSSITGEDERKKRSVVERTEVNFKQNNREGEVRAETSQESSQDDVIEEREAGSVTNVEGVGGRWVSGEGSAPSRSRSEERGANLTAVKVGQVRDRLGDCIIDQSEKIRNTPELTSEMNTHKRKQNVVCEDMKCFVKREDDSDGVSGESNSGVNGGDIGESNSGVSGGGIGGSSSSDIGAGDINARVTKRKWHSPPKNIFNPTLEAISDFSMIQDGDKVLVCLSGGKDSLSLLHTLRQYQHYIWGTHQVTFTIGAATVDPLSTAYDPRPLIPYLASLGVHYLYERQDILQQAAQLENLASICSFCSRMKRGRLYAAARRSSYNVLAMGQHLDDLAESFLMSFFHNGRLRTMKANYTVREGDLRVIRPFVYVREKDLRNFAETKKLPVIPENCPACFEAPKERHRVKQVLAQQEVLFPRLYWSLRSALRPVMSIPCTDLESIIFGKNGAALTRLIVNQSGGDDEDEIDKEKLDAGLEKVLSNMDKLGIVDNSKAKQIVAYNDE